MTIFRVAHSLAVYKNGGYGVKSFAHQINFVGSKQFFVDVERTVVTPIAFAHPLTVLFFRTDKRVFYNTV